MADQHELAADSIVSEAERKPICTIVIIIAMQTEALPLVNKFNLSEDVESVFPKGVPWVRYHGFYRNLDLNVIWPGKDPKLGVDSVGTISASLVTYAAIQALQPDLIINAGTSGGFKGKGANIGDVFIAAEVSFHDRRIPIPVFDLYGVCQKHALSTPNLVKELDLKVSHVQGYEVLCLYSPFEGDNSTYQVGKLSTGDSLDMSPHDETSITTNDATLKDMEGAAIAYTAELLNVPVIFFKAVTDIVDGEKPTAEEFLQNLATVTAALGETLGKAIEFINGKCISEL